MRMEISFKTGMLLLDLCSLCFIVYDQYAIVYTVIGFKSQANLSSCLDTHFANILSSSLQFYYLTT